MNTVPLICNRCGQEIGHGLIGQIDQYVSGCVAELAHECSGSWVA